MKTSLPCLDCGRLTTNESQLCCNSCMHNWGNDHERENRKGIDMGCSMKAVHDSIDAEQNWNDNLAGSKKVLNDKISQPLSEVMNKEAFTKEEFQKLEKAKGIIMEVTGEKKYW